MQALARTLSRGLALAPGRTITCDLQDGELSAAFASLAESAGAQLIAPGEGEGQSGLADHEGPLGFLIPARVRAVIASVASDGPVAILLRGQTLEPEALVDRYASCLKLLRPRAEVSGDALILFGARRPRVPRKQITELRGLGHKLEATLRVGRSGLSLEVVEAVHAALARHGLVKVKLTPQSDADKREVFDELAWATGADLVQRVGKTGLLYRADVPLEPPVKRSGRR